MRLYGSDSLLLDPDLPTGAMLLPFGHEPSSLHIVWQNKKARVGVAEVMISGLTSHWTTHHGIKTGMSLAEVEVVNGGPFSISAGGLTDKPADGKIPELGTSLVLRFLPMNHDARTEVIERYYQGPAWLSSDAEMRSLDLRVTEMRVKLAASRA